MVDAAADTGCDAIKIQTYTADTITMDVDRPEFRITGGLWDGRSLYELYQEAYTPYEWHPAIFERARKRGVTIFSSPFDETAVDLLADLDAPAFKIASFEAVDLPLIRYAAAKGKPLIISTGMANLAEMEAARNAALEAGRARRGAAALRVQLSGHLRRRQCPHRRRHGARGSAARSGSRTTPWARRPRWRRWRMGASIIEKHFTLARADGGPDADFSLEPAEFTALVRRHQGRLGGRSAARTTTCWARSGATCSSAARCTSPPT